MKTLPPLFLAALAFPVLHARPGAALSLRPRPEESQVQREAVQDKAQEKRSQWKSMSPEEKVAKKAEARQKAQSKAGAARARAQSRSYGTK